MLHVINSSPHPAARNKLWFHDAEHDLFVWLDNSKQPVGFQFSYHKNHMEHAINWSSDRGYSHDKIDAGESRPGGYKMTPIMVPDGEFETEKVTEEFAAISREIDKGIAEFVLQKLLDYTH